LIEITRSLARKLRTVFRRASRRSSTLSQYVSFDAHGDGLRTRLHHGEVLVEYQQSGVFPTEAVILPLDALGDFEGKCETPVALEQAQDKTVRVRWNEGVVPQEKEYGVPTSNPLDKYPDLPGKMTVNDPTLLRALADAKDSAAREEAKYATRNIQLRGGSGTLVATDGHELLSQSGFQLPWTEDVLVPAVPIFACRELLQGGPLRIGKSASHVTLQSGPWTLHLPIDTQGRYPPADQVIPSLTGNETRLTIAAEDAAFLAKTLPSLPGDEANSPVTVDLNGEICIRTKASGQERTTEVLLARSQASDKAVRFLLNRNLLARALALGFSEIHVLKPDTPVVCQDERRKLVVMPLGTDGALKPTEDAIRIASVKGESAQPKPQTERRKPAVKSSSEPKAVIDNGAKAPSENGASHAKTNGTTREKTGRTGISALIVEAEALKGILRDAFNRSRQLISAIRRHKRQAHAVQTTLASLRQLQRIDG
jgi:hypothetical protein